MRATKPPSRVLAAAAVLVASLAWQPPARAAVPHTDITSTGPLNTIAIGNDLSCQVLHESDTDFQFYPPSESPGDCGTFLVVDGVLFAPDYQNHAGSATHPLDHPPAFTSVSQSAVSGQGTAADPYRIVTVADAAQTGIRITQTDTYVTGQGSYRTDVEVSNTGGIDKDVLLYRAADCYLGGSDSGYGFRLPEAGAVACTKTPNNSPTGRVEQWVPLSGDSHFFQAGYGDVWLRIGEMEEFNDTCLCDTELDNGAGLSWALSVPAAGRVLRSHLTNFSDSAVITRLAVNPAVADVSASPELYFPNVSATLTTADGEPVEGASVAFYAGDMPICSSPTDENGVAACPEVEKLVDILMNNGYTAIFAGTGQFLASFGQAPVLLVDGTPLP